MSPKVVRELQLLRHEMLGSPPRSTEEDVVREVVTSAA
jgi:hypothetical protein